VHGILRWPYRAVKAGARSQVTTLSNKIPGSAVFRKNFLTADPVKAMRFGARHFNLRGHSGRGHDGSADLCLDRSLAQQLPREARSPKLVVEKALAPPVPEIDWQRALSAHSPSKGGFRWLSIRNVLREGRPSKTFFHPDRSWSASTIPHPEQLREIYSYILERKFNTAVHQGKCPIIQNQEFLVTRSAVRTDQARGRIAFLRGNQLRQQRFPKSLARSLARC